MITGPTGAYTVLSALLDAVSDALDASPGGRPSRTSVQPGAIVWDQCDCKDGSQLIVSVTEQYLTDTFPHVNLTRNPVELTPCRASWVVVNAMMQVIRCDAQPANGQVAPDDVAVDRVAQLVLSDAWEILNSTACHLQEMKDTDQIIDYSIANALPTGPTGGCVGFELAFSFALSRGVS